MKKIAIVIVLLVLVSGLAAQELTAVKMTDLETRIREAKAPLVINFWATWCRPCVEEIPYFLDEIKKHNTRTGADTVQLWLVSLDMKESYPDIIRQFVSRRGWQGSFLWLNETNADYFCPRIDSSWSGAIPATLFINPATGYRLFREEQISRQELGELLKQLVRPR